MLSIAVTILDTRVGLTLGVVGAVSMGAVAARSQETEEVVDEKTGEESPNEEAESNGSSGSTTANSDGHGDGPGEPEDSGDAFKNEGDKAVETASEDEGNDGDIDENEDGPDGVKEHKCPRRGRVAPPPVVCDINTVASQA